MSGDLQARWEEGVEGEESLITELTGLGLSRNRVLSVIGLHKSTYHYRHHPRDRVDEPIPHRDRPHPARLCPEERDRVEALLRASTTSVAQTFFDHLDTGSYLASESTFRRIARAEGITLARTGRNRRGPHKTAPRAVPRLEAREGADVVCWDISFLPGFYRGEHFALYLAIHLRSRKIAGWSIQNREDEIIAAQLINDILDSDPTITTVHSDNGAAMKSHRMRKVCADHHVTQSFIRPGVSNDNAANESFFRTVKYGPTYPTVFHTLAQADEWMSSFVEYYNNHHHHSSLAGYTPQEVHDGTWTTTWQTRQTALTTAYQAHPQRFRHPPTARKPPQIAHINLADNHTHTPPTTTELIAG